MNRTAITLEFDKILEKLKEHTLSAQARARADALEPILNEDLLAAALRETQDARRMIEENGVPPLGMMEELAESVKLSTQDGLLTPEQLSGIATFCNTCRRMALYLRKGEATRIELSLNGRAFLPLEDLQLEIEDAIRGDEVSDSASNALRDVRRKISLAEDQVKTRLNRLLQGHKEWFADGYVAIRGGRSTLPVKAQYKAQVPGSVIDRSQTGGTVFIEPAAVRAAQEEVMLLKLDEENEIRRVLYALTALVADCAPAIESNMRLMERLDFAFAKGKLSLAMDARAVPITRERELHIVNGRHPLLDPAVAVPLTFRAGQPQKDGDALRGVIITGPNTGGKTVALKTIGLFAMMAQSGLHIPAGEGSTLCMNDRILADIGDGQSIAENLSTFSSHMVKVLGILKTATRDSLVLLDELGSGTDPAEGMGLAVAVLEELAARGCLFVVTTHYPEIKEFARQTPGLINARMTFNPETLQPLYQMRIGEAGESCALMIAKRLGFPDALLDRAREAAYSAGGPTAQIPARKDNAPSIRPSGGGPKLNAFEAPKTAPPRALAFHRGDSVRVYPDGLIGIVWQESDERGILGVQLKGQKKEVPYKRLQLIAPAEQMYPPDYDFSIVFDSVANRKARHTMGRKHDPSAVVREEPENP